MPQFRVVPGSATSLASGLSAGLQPDTWFLDPVLDGVTAFSGGGQASATQLAAQVNRINATVSTSAPFDSVKLPSAVGGLEVVAINNTNNPIQVFGFGADTINGLASITQPPNSVDIYIAAAAGAWHVEAGVGYSGQLFCELSQDNITARSGGGQASATQIVAQTNRLITVAASGDSIKLPPSAPGLEVLIINHSNNPAQVFGFGTDVIDDIASSAGVSQMVSSFVIYACASTGSWYSEGLANGFANGLQTVSTLDSVTATGTTQGTATVLPTRMAYNVTTVPAGTGVLIPPSVAGAEIAIASNGANTLLIYPTGAEKINALAPGAGLSTPASTVMILYCFTAGQWFSK